MSALALPPHHRTARRAVRLTVAVLSLALAAGCTSGGGGGKSGAQGKPQDGPSAVAPDTSPSPEPPKVTLTPADGSTGVPPTSPVSVEAQEGTLSTVTVKSASGGAVQGAIDGSGKKWSSKGKLAFGATYTIEVTASGDTAPRQAGKFSTTPTPGSAKSVRASSILGDHKTYGVAMPIILKLDDPLPTKAQRAAFEQGLTVKSTPPATGAWGWINSKEIHFRPAEFWAAGSTVHLGVDTAGRDLGNGMWGRTDLTVDFKIGTKRELRADSKSHHMLVWESGKLVKDMPVSLGRPKFPSSRGTMVIIDKRPTAMFDSSTYGLPVDDPEGYRTKVDLPMRLTWGGEFIHSAPWSVNQQGKVNVSHGCINVAPANAQWLYNRIQVGDPVTVLNTEEAVKFGDGYMDWSLPFNGWLSHSASGQHSTA